MEKTVLKADGISCEHCVKTITKTVGALPRIGGVAVNPETGTVTADYDGGKSPLDKIKPEIEDQGYEAVA
ncbi:MAG: cation transporter [Synergistaceae bacterium]|jgi:copper chaperone|nr:cation transporter [Synergistaceae bacterium]